MFRLRMIAFIAFSFVAQPSAAEWVEQSCTSAHRIPVTVTAGPTGHSSETRITLTNADFPSAYQLSPNGDDVRVFLSDDLTPVDFSVTDWNPITRDATIFIRRPAMAAASSTSMFVYFGDPDLTSTSNAAVVFPDIGVRLRSRISTVDPVSASDALAAFAAATVDVYDAVRSSVSGINNRAVGGTNGDYGWCISATLNVTAATAGVWGFRYGADFGRGGHLYVKGQELEQQWNDDLWWANNYANTAETLEGTIDLPVGWHRYEALGFEGCCDGPTGFQAQPPGGAWQDLSSSNFSLRGAQCVQTTATVSLSAAESCSTVLNPAKTVTIVSDPAGNPSPYALPGSVVRYELSVINPGQEVDATALVLTDALPSQLKLLTGAGTIVFSDGAISSGLGFSYGGPSDTADSVEFSTDGADFSAVGTDPAVTHIRFRPSGTFNANDAGDEPSFSISFLAEVL